MSDIQQRVQEAIDELVASGAESGLQVAAYRNGELVVDAVAGVADATTGRPVTSDTPFYTYSLGKAMTTAVTYSLIDRGHFDYDTPIAELWPEFGAHGKHTATVRHIMTHTLGVLGVPADSTPELLCDWDAICVRLADAELSWEPGTKTAYHAYPYGYILGEIARRVTGKRISELLRDDVAGPLGVADELYFGVPASELDRLARLEDADGSAEFLASMPDDSPFFRLGPRAVTPTAEFGNRPDVLRADIPAGGKTSARAVARLYAALLGPVDGVRLFSPTRSSEAYALAYEGVDDLFGSPVRWSLGFSVGGLDGADTQTFGWGGVGGSYAGADPATGLTYAVTKNRLGFDFETSKQLIALVKKGFED